VGDEDHRDPDLMPDLQQVFLHHRPGLRVQRAERFVHQQDARRVGQGAGDGHALLHAAGQGLRALVAERGEADHLQQAVGDLPRLVVGQPGHARTVGDVFPHRLPGKQRRLLEHHAALGGRPRYHRAIDPDRAAGRMFQPGDGVQQDRFSASGGPGDADEFAGGDFRADPVDGQERILARTEQD